MHIAETNKNHVTIIINSIPSGIGTLFSQIGDFMDKVYETHQLHFFANLSDIDPASHSQLITSVISNALPDCNLSTSVAEEINFATRTSRKYLIINNQEEKLRIEFPQGEIAIFQEGEKTREEFKEIVRKIMQGLEELVKLKFAHRLSILHSKFYQGNEDEYNTLYNNLFTYKKVQPFEWDNRIVTRGRLKVSEEDINCVSIIRRIKAKINNTPSRDVIGFEVDSNTIAENNTPRFDIKNSTSVFDELFEECDRMMKKLGYHIS